MRFQSFIDQNRTTPGPSEASGAGDWQDATALHLCLSTGVLFLSVQVNLILWVSPE